jgi:FLVCR family MFS transporter 7
VVDTVRSHNYAGLYPVFIFIGIGSFILLPVALEIGVEVTSSAESSSAVFWCGANILTTVFVEVGTIQMANLCRDVAY